MLLFRTISVVRMEIGTQSWQDLFKCPGNRCFLLVGMRGAHWYKHGMDEQHRVFRNTVRHAYSYHRVFLEKYVVGSNRNLSKVYHDKYYKVDRLPFGL